MSSFAHLHLHSQYSLLDGANRIGDVVQAAAAAGMPAIALTDHGNMFGAVDFYNQARKAGVKPILGIEAYTTLGKRRDRDPRRAKYNHLVLLAKNEAGYRNLLKLTSRSFLEGFYYKPRMDKELLREHREGLIAFSGCLKGEMHEAIQRGGYDAAEEVAREFLDIFGEDNFYLELQDHGIRDQIDGNEVLRKLARKLNLKTVATNDCHYLHKDDAKAHDVLLCIGTQRTLADTDRLRYASEEFYLKSRDEMLRVFPKDGEAVDNSLLIAERCNVEIPTGKFHLPEFPVPEGYTLESYFEEVTRQGLEERLEELRRRNAQVLTTFSPELYRERLETEIGIIRKMGFPGYFLVVWDFMRYSRSQQIPVGPGRGSAAGSLVAYSLRITDVDPLQYGLLFERFLNPDRVSMPDIDIDFCMRRRGEVISYVSDKYGKDKVAQIITFGTLAAKAVIRDVGRVMGVPYGKVDRIAKLVPDMTRSLAQAAQEIDGLKKEVREDPEVAQIVEIGSRLEGLTRHASIHAAGVVITPQPTEELVPLYRVKKGDVETIMTQWDMNVVESLGLLKMDFLGLRTLTVIDDAVKLLAQQGIEIDFDRMGLEDPVTYQLFCDGRTSGVFQFESAGMRELLRRAQPSRFEDLAAFNALYRPGALSVGMVDEYIQRKLGRRRVAYLIPETKPILEETYGVIVYQEQVMKIASEVAGFTLGEADILRKAMGKKNAEAMAEQKEKFVDGAEKRGFERDKARALWEYIEPFAGYGFNKSHSVAYALLAYRTAYLKAHHPVAFMSAMLNSEMGNAENIAKYMGECRQMDIPVLPPDVNLSEWQFTVEERSARVGLGAVKGVGEAAINALLEARRRVGHFRNLTHLACEADPRAVNNKVFDCLIKAGACDSLEPNRRALLESLGSIVDYAQGKHRERAAGQVSLFGGSMALELEPKPDSDKAPWSDRERLGFEKETLGFYLSGHPLSDYRRDLARLASHDVATLKEEGAESLPEGPVRVGGLVTRLRRVKIKSGRNEGRFMARFVLEDTTGTLPVPVFANQLEQYGSRLLEGAVVLIKGAVRDRGGELELNLEEVASLDRDEDRILALDVEVPAGVSQGEMLKLRDLILENPGEIPVNLCLDLEDLRVQVAPRRDLQVTVGPELLGAIETLIGAGSARPRRPARV